MVMGELLLLSEHFWISCIHLALVVGITVKAWIYKPWFGISLALAWSGEGRRSQNAGLAYASELNLPLVRFEKGHRSYVASCL